MCQGLSSQKSLIQQSPGLFFTVCVMSFIVMQNPERATHSCWALCACQAEFYIPLKIFLLPPSSSFGFSSLTPPLLSVILPDYYSRGQSGIRTDPWHWSWIVGFLRCLLVYVCVCKTDLERASKNFFLVFVCGSSSANLCQLRCGRNAHSYFSQHTFPKERTVFLNSWAEAPEIEGGQAALSCKYWQTRGQTNVPNTPNIQLVGIFLLHSSLKASNSWGQI